MTGPSSGGRAARRAGFPAEVVSQVPAEVVSLVDCVGPMASEEGVIAAAQVPAEVVSLVDCVGPMASGEGEMAAAAASEAASEEGMVVASEKR